jgi:hypothetical protein
MIAATTDDERVQTWLPLAGYAQELSDEAAALFGFLAGGAEHDLPREIRAEVADALRGALASLRGAAALIGRASPEAEAR